MIYFDFQLADDNIPKRNDSKFPLLHTINEAIDLTFDEIYPGGRVSTDEVAKEIETKVPKVVCPLVNMAFNFKKYNWLWCTHVISVDETKGGKFLIQIEQFYTFFSFPFFL